MFSMLMDRWDRLHGSSACRLELNVANLSRFSCFQILSQSSPEGCAGSMPQKKPPLGASKASKEAIPFVEANRSTSKEEQWSSRSLSHVISRETEEGISTLSQERALSDW
jgi:hypothetical protein